MRLDVILARAVRTNIRAFVLIILCIEFGLCGISIFQAKSAYVRIKNGRRDGTFGGAWSSGEPLILRAHATDRPVVVIETLDAERQKVCVHVGRVTLLAPLRVHAHANISVAWDQQRAQWLARTPCGATNSTTLDVRYATPTSTVPLFARTATLRPCATIT